MLFLIEYLVANICFDTEENGRLKFDHLRYPEPDFYRISGSANGGAEGRDVGRVSWFGSGARERQAGGCGARHGRAAGKPGPGGLGGRPYGHGGGRLS